MSQNVLSLWGGPTGLPSRNQQTVDLLTDLLEKAEAGEIIGVCATSLHKDGLAAYVIGGIVGSYGMLGAIEVMKSEMIEVVRDA